MPEFISIAHVAGSSGKRAARLYVPNSTWTRSFAATMLIQTILALAIESYVSITFQGKLKDVAQNQMVFTPIRAFFGLYIFGVLYELLLSYDALREENTVQLIGLCICNIALSVCGIIQVQRIKTALETLEDLMILTKATIWPFYKVNLVLIPVIVAIGSIGLIGSTWKLYEEFSWAFYKNACADLQLKRRYITYQFFITLLKFDFFFICGSSIQILVIVTNQKSVDFILNTLLVPIALLVLGSAAYCARHENNTAMLYIIVFLMCIVGSFISMLVRIYSPTTATNYSHCKASLTVFAVTAIFLILLTAVNAVACVCNSCKGFTVHINNSKDLVDATDTHHGLRGNLQN